MSVDIEYNEKFMFTLMDRIEIVIKKYYPGDKSRINPEIYDDILAAIGESFNLDAVVLNSGSINIVSDNTAKGTVISIENKKIHNIASLDWNLRFGERGKLTLEVI